TDDATMDVVEMVLVGSVNKDIVNQINQAGGKAVGLSGKDGTLLKARRKGLVINRENLPPEIIDIGNVGEVVHVETSLLRTLIRDGFVPVIAPVGVDAEGHTYNINADDAAGAVAAALKACRFLLLTDVPGVLDAEKKLIRTLTADDAARLIADGTISGGMIPKINCCLDALAGGAGRATVLDGRVENCLLLELLTDQGVGTQLGGHSAAGKA
ncbi:MAG: acetylglutamate kinase, partial [Desulfovibrionaceae bacterium]|nr:acetylglutamate kinase [Desulfovibrionaceae bacterium]